MNHHSTIFIALAALASGAALAQEQFSPDAPPPAQEGVKYTLLKPADKSSEQVKADERNPFVKVDDCLAGPNQKALNEENQIRDRLSKLRVCGVMPGQNGLRVMLGDIVLESGQVVPQMLADQSVALRVGSITPQAIELQWLEQRKDGMAPRKVVIPVDLRPYVRYMLQGRAVEKPADKPDKIDESVGRVFPVISDSPGAAGQLNAQPRSGPSTVQEAALRELAELPVSGRQTTATPAPASQNSEAPQVEER